MTLTEGRAVTRSMPRKATETATTTDAGTRMASVDGKSPKNWTVIIFRA